MARLAHICLANSLQKAARAVPRITGWTSVRLFVGVDDTQMEFPRHTEFYRSGSFVAKRRRFSCWMTLKLCVLVELYIMATMGAGLTYQVIDGRYIDQTRRPAEGKRPHTLRFFTFFDTCSLIDLATITFSHQFLLMPKSVHFMVLCRSLGFFAQGKCNFRGIG